MSDNDADAGDDIADVPPGRGVVERSVELFSRWERQQWSALDPRLDDDVAGWNALRRFTRDELSSVMMQFFVGETAVTETLAPLAHAAPTHEQQCFLCTQLADEARHALFFQRYLRAVRGDMESFEDLLSACWSAAPDGQAQLFERKLRATVETVARDPADRASWYEGIALYHLVVEGVLAVTGQKVLLSAVRRMPRLPALLEGLRNVTRDESRHIAFGIETLHQGTSDGYGGRIIAVVVEAIPSAVETLVNPSRRQADAVARLKARRAPALQLVWDSARRSLIRRLEFAGLAGALPEVTSTWDAAVEASLDRYEQLHDTAHPVRAWLTATAA